MTDTLRDRANMEILDVFKNVNRQVFGREKQQIAVFPETILPNTQRDTGTEVNVDKSIEQMNKTMEAKLGNVQLLVENIQRLGATIASMVSGEYPKMVSESTNTSDIIPLWNQIVRYYQQPGLSKNSQEMIKVSVQQLKPNLDALQYGYQLSADTLLGADINTIPRRARPIVAPEPELKLTEEQERAWIDRQRERLEARPSDEELQKNASKSALMVMEFLRAESVYKIIKQQVASTGFEILDNESLNSAYKNNFQRLSQNEINYLKSYAPRGSLMPSTIRNIPDFGSQTTVQRLRQIQEELGIELPDQLLSEFRKMPLNQLNEELDKLRKDKKVPATQEMEERYQEEKLERGIELDRLAQMYNILNAEIESLKEEYRTNEEFVPLPLPEVPKKIKRRPNATPEEKQEYKDNIEERRAKTLERDLIQALNEHHQDLLRSRDERIELINEKEYDLEQLNRMFSRASDDYDEMTKMTPGVVKATPRETSSLEQYAQRFPVEGFGKPKRTRVDTRGLAGMRANYGKPEESESESESDEGDSSDEGGAMDFDDDRNEHYTRKPVPYY